MYITKYTDLENLFSEDFFDCECETHYIHSKDDDNCIKCGANKEDQPDSIMAEIKVLDNHFKIYSYEPY